MRFSEAFDIERVEDDDWFDPVLFTDTRLFIDPFRIWADSDPYWTDAHNSLMEFFNAGLKLVAESGGNERSVAWKKAELLFLFQEPKEFCLGYAMGSPRGSGCGPGLRKGVLEGAKTAIFDLGISEVGHFEELTLFEAGIGADRISDIVCNVLKEYFIGYTQAVCERHEIELVDIQIPNAYWDRGFLRWETRKIGLPPNQFIQSGVLLTPRRFLRELPSVDPGDFWAWAWQNENEQIRGDFNYDIARNVDAREIARLARLNPHIVNGYVRSLEGEPKDPYDTEEDPKGEVRWWEAGASLALASPLTRTPDRPHDFYDFVEHMIERFRHNIQQQDGWQQLWYRGDRPQPERIVQSVFRSAVIHYCQANDIDLSGEANAGRGPVDFKFSQGWERRALVEIKLTNNSKYWHGLKKQTVQYLKSEGIERAYLLSVNLREDDLSKERKDTVRSAANDLKRTTGKDVHVVFVDGRPKTPASKS